MEYNINKISDNIRKILGHLPDQPGIYMYFDKHGDILYIGKAKNLKNRVRSYFNGTQVGKTKYLVKKICHIEYTVVETEQDALLLENNLVKEHQPPYNIRLKDDKTFPWICIVNERFPRVIKTRKLIKGEGIYFGPYTNIKLVYVLLEMFHKVFKIRTCTYELSEKNISNKKFRVCMEYQVGNCKAPCVGKQNELDYLENIQRVKKILK
jgi:excinuclease ABC subunit C